MSISEQKKVLRKQIRIKKQNFSSDEKIKSSASIVVKIEQTAIFKNSEVILAYWSLGDEVQTHDFILRWYTKKTILLPVVDNAKLLVKQFRGMQFLDKGRHYGIQEPIGEPFRNEKSIDLVIVPGLAFDNAGNRLGRGMAFYDNFLRQLPAYKLGICFGFQFVPSVPVDENDVRMNEIIFA